MDFETAKAFVVWVFTESYKGRVARWDYFKQRVMLLLAGLALGTLLFLLSAAGSVLVLSVYVLVLIPVWFLLFYRSITLDIQRLHDLDLAGWWLALVFGLSLVPAIGIISSLAAMGLFLFVPGTVGANRFGADTLGGVTSTKVVTPRAAPAVSKSFAQLVKAKPEAKVAKKAKPAKAVAKKAKVAAKTRGGKKV